MSEYISSEQLRAGSSTTAADFIAHVDTSLTIDSLVTRFSQALGPSAASHTCYRVENGQRLRLFGEAAWSGLIARSDTLSPLDFAITGWDEREYAVEIRLFGAPVTADERANLHAMAVLYVCRGAALLDACDDPETSALTATEQFCLDKRQAGWCDLDIADALHRSVHAVQVHVARASLKQAALT